MRARLMQLWDLFGPASMDGVRWIANQDRASFYARLGFAAGGRIHFHERRAPGLPRGRSMALRCRDGEATWPAESRTGGLFAEDLAWFSRRVRERGPGYAADEHVVGVLNALAGSLPCRIQESEGVSGVLRAYDPPSSLP